MLERMILTITLKMCKLNGTISFDSVSFNNHSGKGAVMRKQRFYAVLFVLLCPLFGASPASAETVEGKKTVFGVADTTSLGSLPANHSASYTWERAYRDLKALKAGVLRVPLNMRTTSLSQPVSACDPASVSTANPAVSAYDWTLPDLIARQAQAVSVRLIFDIDITPSWLGADKSLPSSWVVGDFACAAQTRYMGNYPDPLRTGQDLPKVSLWEILNEPNMASHYNPTVNRATPPDRTVSWPAAYAKLADSAAAQIHGINPDAEVAAGALANAGTIAPLDFLAGMAQAVPNPSFDVISIHPYPLDWVTDTPTWAPAGWSGGDVTFANLDQLRAALLDDWPKRHFNLWLTEIAWQTNQVDDSEGVSLQQQADYLQQVFDIANQPSSDIEFVCWFLLLSEPQLNGYSTGFQTGLSYMSGPKLNGRRVLRAPAFYTFIKWQTKH